MDLVKFYRYQSDKEALMAYCLRMLRQLGTAEGSDGHLDILEDYNALAQTRAGLPRGHKADPSDDWCAIYAAGQAHAVGLTEAYPMECSCSRIVQIAREMGIWIESDSYIPIVGDWILYAWKGQEGQENDLAPNHIGIIYGCDGENMLAVEGNKGDKVDVRKLPVGDKRIRGFVHPDLSGLVGSLIAPAVVEKVQEPVVPVVPVDPKLPVLYATVEQVPEWGRAAVAKLQERGWLQGVAEGDLGLTEELVRTLTVLDRAGVFELPI